MIDYKDDNDNIVLKIDENNELIFDVNIQTSSALSSPPLTRFIVNEASGELSYIFHGKANKDGKISVIIPSMEKKLIEGEYDSILEVIVESKVFSALKIKSRFEKSLKVEAKRSVENLISNKKNNNVKVETKLVSVGSLKELYEKSKK